MGLCASVILGGLAGWITGKLMRGQGYGAIGNIIVGVIGAAVGGFLTNLVFGVDMVSGFNITSLIVSIVGAIVVTAVFGLLTRGRAA